MVVVHIAAGALGVLAPIRIIKLANGAFHIIAVATRVRLLFIAQGRRRLRRPSLRANGSFCWISGC